MTDNWSHLEPSLVVFTSRKYPKGGAATAAATAAALAVAVAVAVAFVTTVVVMMAMVVVGAVWLGGHTLKASGLSRSILLPLMKKPANLPKATAF